MNSLLRYGCESFAKLEESV